MADPSILGPYIYIYIYIYFFFFFFFFLGAAHFGNSRIKMCVCIHVYICICMISVEAIKLEHDRPPTPNQRKKEHQLKTAYIGLSKPTRGHVRAWYGLLAARLRPIRADLHDGGTWYVLGGPGHFELAP